MDASAADITASDLTVGTFLSVDTISSFTFAEKLWIEITYNGFSPSEFRKWFNLTYKPTLKELSLFIGICINVGTNPKNWVTEKLRKGAWAAWMKDMANKWKVQKNKATAPATPEGEMLVTAARIMLAYGDITISVLSSLKSDLLWANVKGKAIYGLPLAYMWPGSISFVPDDFKLQKEYIVWAVTFDYTITKDKLSWSIVDAYDRVLRFFQIQSSTIGNPKNRTALYVRSQSVVGSVTIKDALEGMGGDITKLSKLLIDEKIDIDLVRMSESQKKVVIKEMKSNKKDGKAEKV